MERERFENLIIEYIEGTLSRQEEDEFLSALTEHEELREIYDQYLSIRNIIDEEEDISPSDEILKNISEYARESVKNENPSIIKKWFSIPVLAPLLGTAIIAMFWFTVGDEYLKNKNIINVGEVSSDKSVKTNYQVRSNEEKQANDTVIAEEQILDLETYKFKSSETEELDAVASAPAAATSVEDSGKPNASIDDEPYLQQESQEIIADNKGKSSLARSTQTPVSEDAAGFADEQGKDDLQENMKVASESNAVLEEAVNNRSEFRVLKKESVGAKVATAKPEIPTTPEGSAVGTGEVFREKINDVLAQQYKGDCQNSIKLSNEVLNSKPEPPTAVQTTLYLSQAECYEELNQIDNAIKSYEKVQTIDPASTSFFSSKIRQLNMKKVK